MKPKPLPPQDVLKEIFDYDPETGVLTRKINGNCLWHSDRDGYLRVNVLGSKRAVHRVVWKLFYGHDPDTVDHINGRPDDNRIENLRSADHQTNNRNKTTGKNNTSGYPGVSYVRSDNLWLVRINHDGKRKYIGMYKDKLKAIEARKNAEKKYGYTVRNVSTEPKNAE